MLVNENVRVKFIKEVREVSEAVDVTEMRGDQGKIYEIKLRDRMT